MNDFKSLHELMSFQRNYSTFLQEITSKHTSLIDQEKRRLNEEIIALNESIKAEKTEAGRELRAKLEKVNHKLKALSANNSGLLQPFITSVKKFVFKMQFRFTEQSMNNKISGSAQHLINSLIQKQDRYHYIDSSYEEAVNQSASTELHEINRRKKLIDELNSTIYGAIGEQKVVKELEKLSDDYFLINDFTCAFNPPIYNKNENDYIRSVQIDHILIGPSGVFLIETKNWSEHSLNNLSLRSPVQQIKRTSFALFKTLNEKLAANNSIFNRHHWGERKISMRNLIVMINHKPEVEFQYVKVVTLKELLSYIQYFKPVYSQKETQQIVNYLLYLNK